MSKINEDMAPEKLPAPAQQQDAPVPYESVPPPSYDNAFRSKPVPSYTPAAGPSASPVGKATGLSPTDARDGDSPYIASMRAWAKEKEFINDNFGGHKGIAVGEPNDPFKLFKWAGRKMSGKPKPQAKQPEDATARSPFDPPIVAVGDMDTSKIA
jgi:hypothetical protein